MASTMFAAALTAGALYFLWHRSAATTKTPPGGSSSSRSSSTYANVQRNNQWYKSTHQPEDPWVGDRIREDFHDAQSVTTGPREIM